MSGVVALRKKKIKFDTMQLLDETLLLVLMMMLLLFHSLNPPHPIPLSPIPEFRGVARVARTPTKQSKKCDWSVHVCMDHFCSISFAFFDILFCFGAVLSGVCGGEGRRGRISFSQWWLRCRCVDKSGCMMGGVELKACIVVHSFTSAPGNVHANINAKLNTMI